MAALISDVTDVLNDDVKTWPCRPFYKVYPIGYLDALYVNIKVLGRVNKRASCYGVLGITQEGTKALPGLWIGEAEGAKFWLKVLTALKNRGKDILMACCHGLAGFPLAFETVDLLHKSITLTLNPSPYGRGTLILPLLPMGEGAGDEGWRYLCKKSCLSPSPGAGVYFHLGLRCVPARTAKPSWQTSTSFPTVEISLAFQSEAFF